MSDITKEKQAATFTSFPKQKMKNSQNSSLWWMYLPAVLVVSTFIIYPFFNGIQLSLQIGTVSHNSMSGSDLINTNGYYKIQLHGLL